MIDPLRSETSAASPDVSERERDARVEDLLLGGLDHYFVGHFELAINVWTRVLFLDRGHARARAYIERARGAVSERQRHGEELIQAGADAFERGDADAARGMLLAAVEQGAGNDDAMALLARLDRLAAAGVPRQHHSDPPGPFSRHPLPDPLPHSRRLRWTLAGAVSGAIVVLAGVFWVVPDGRLHTAPPAASRPEAAPADEGLPVPSAGDIWLARARAHRNRGHLREALAALDAIRPGDRRLGDADRLRSEIQAILLAAARARDTTGLGQDGGR